MRTQVGELWSTSSADGGATLAAATPSGLASSDSPPFLLRLRSGALLLLWVNVRTTAPLACEHKPHSVYSVRHLLHAALSTDSGATWSGRREVYRDPMMRQQPPKRGDIGVAYSYGLELSDGSVLFRTGQGIGRTQLVRLDPQWLTSSATQSKLADFASVEAQETWNDPRAIGSDSYGTTCMYYRAIPAEQADPLCNAKTDGTTLQQQKDDGKPALCLALPSPLSADAALTGPQPAPTTATFLWNFGAATAGTITARVRASGDGFSMALADASMPSWDLAEQQASVFATNLPPLPLDKWCTVRLKWGSMQSCTLSVDGGDPVPVSVGRTANEGALSYLVLRGLSAGPSSKLCVRTIEFEATRGEDKAARRAKADGAPRVLAARLKSDEVSLRRPSLNSEGARNAAVSVGIGTGVAVNRIRDEYVSFNLDSTFDRGFFSRNLDNPHLVYLAKQLTSASPAFLRLGGSGGNEMSYGVGNITCEQQAAARDYRCPFPGNYSCPSWFLPCLNGSHWASVNRFVQKSGAQMIWGMNPAATTDDLRDFFAFSKSINASFAGIEPSNESGFNQTALAKLIAVLRELYPDKSSRPRLVGIDMQANCADCAADLRGFLNASVAMGEPALAGTYHNYRACVSPPTQQQFYNFSEQMNAALKSSVIANTELWVGETAAGCNGGASQEATFAGGFWYLESLGGLALTHKAFLRQSLIGGHYGMLRDSDPCAGWHSHPARSPCLNEHYDSCPVCGGAQCEQHGTCASADQPGGSPQFFPRGTALQPNGDYWIALLFKRLVGRNVLKASIAPAANYTTGLSAYSFCSRQHPGGVVLTFVNTGSAVTMSVNITAGLREEYHLTAGGRSELPCLPPPRGTCNSQCEALTSQSVALNGVNLTANVKTLGPMPALSGKAVDASTPMTVAPCSYGFVVLPAAAAPACKSDDDGDDRRDISSPRLDADEDAAPTLEELRPIFHYSECEGEMNDPNGLQWRRTEAGDVEHHLFFQHQDPACYPIGGKGSHVWGHTRSPDLIRWKRMPNSGVCSSSGGGISFDTGQGPDGDWKAIVVGSLPHGGQLPNGTYLGSFIGMKVWSSSDEHLEKWTQYQPVRPKSAIDPNDPCTMCPDDVPLSVQASYIGDNYASALIWRLMSCLLAHPRSPWKHCRQGWSVPRYGTGTPSANRTFYWISGAGRCPDTGPHAKPWCGWPYWGSHDHLHTSVVALEIIFRGAAFVPDMPPGSSNASAEHPQMLLWQSANGYDWEFKSVMWELPGAQDGFQTSQGGVWTNNRFDCPDSWELPDGRQIITVLGSLWGIGTFDRETGRFTAEHTGIGGCGPQQSMYDDKGRRVQFCSEGFALPGANYSG